MINDRKQLLAWLVLLALLFVAYLGWQKSQFKPAANREAAPVSAAQKSRQQNKKPEAALKRAEVMTTMLNFRVRPELKDENVVATLKKGTIVEVLEQQEKWLKVKLTDGRVGYISAQPGLVRVF